jgi:hypothetical protein
VYELYGLTTDEKNIVDAGGKPEKNNPNADVMLRDTSEFAPVASVADFKGHRDVTPKVAGGAVQIVGIAQSPKPKK